jgi:hypothetical protein
MHPAGSYANGGAGCQSIRENVAMPQPRFFRLVLITCLIVPVAARAGEDAAASDIGLSGSRIDGYRGIWFTLGQVSERGDKYSGGLGTYTANHLPMAVYSPKVGKTFFVYGGTTAAEERRLLCMIGWYDHATGRVPRPVVVHDKLKVNDPHDNPAVNLDAKGHVWVFVSGRGLSRPGFKYCSVAPYSIDGFERVEEREMTYPQVHVVPGEGFMHLFTKYTNGRELYWQTSADGRTWDSERKLAGMGGHYQVSGRHGGTIGTAFMYHPGGDVDRRTNLYYVQTPDSGRTWTTAAGEPVRPPLADVKGPALLIDYEARGLNVYIHDLNFDRDGHPAILYLTSRGALPGPQNGPYTWRVTRWIGRAWETHDVTTSDHNYDTGSLYTEDDGEWRVVGPTDPGPQPHAAGGEVVAWTSRDRGATWRRAAQLTRGSQYNHTYARRPLGATDPFYTYWADGDPRKLSPSRLYFANRAGDRVWRLPYDMAGETAEPVEVGP